MILKRYFATVLISLLSCVVSAVASAKEDIALLDQVAVLVYAQSEAGTQYVANARNRLEVILGDNGITVLDQNTADELKNVWNKLEDPGFIITAEDFVDNAGKYDVDGILAIYLTVDSARGLANSFTATAHADLRFVAANAKVEPVTTASMGVRGNPASDGLTQEAASVNAVQRAIDNAALQVGLDVSEQTVPGALSIELIKEDDLPESLFAKPHNEFKFEDHPYIDFHEDTWLMETQTCGVLAPSGGIAAIAGYVRDTDMARKPQRLYGSRMHVVDIQGQKTITTFIVQPVAKKRPKDNGTSKVLDCAFIYNWRYLAAVNGNYIFLWDIERGILLSKMRLPSAVTKTSLGFHQKEGKDYLLLGKKRRTHHAYRIAIK